MTPARFRALLSFVVVFVAIAGPASAQTIFVQDTFTTGVNTTLEAHTPDTGGSIA